MKAPELIPDLELTAAAEHDEESGLFMPVAVIRWTGEVGGEAQSVETVSRCFADSRFKTKNEAITFANLVIGFVLKLTDTGLL